MGADSESDVSGDVRSSKPDEKEKETKVYSVAVARKSTSSSIEKKSATVNTRRQAALAKEESERFMENFDPDRLTHT